MTMDEVDDPIKGAELQFVETVELGPGAAAAGAAGSPPRGSRKVAKQHLLKRDDDA